mmetsp:Transcript_5700/g.16054  ORF Transcript_5700/g.16054 Transcript_5700/m.16054 type:complete len:324 (-) Transcript_5700:26-997(-)
MTEFSSAGFSGCCGSTDATHVSMERCSAWLTQANSGSKLSMPSRTYNVTVNHRRRIMSSTSGHPARWNDKTLQLFDNFLMDLNQGRILSDNDFVLYEKDSSGEVHFGQYQGAWVIVDNGYIQWPTTIPPYKLHTEYNQVRWSKWLESMRKDVECTFGIMKGRFRILKAGIRVHGVVACDRIWLTCCGLHNLLIDVDGLEEGWYNNNSIHQQSEWLGVLGNHDPESFGLAPDNIRRLFNTEREFTLYDSSGMGARNDMGEEVVTGSAGRPASGKTFDVGDLSIRKVRELDFTFFRERLVEHFDICFQNGWLCWPECNGKRQQRY